MGLRSSAGFLALLALTGAGCGREDGRPAPGPPAPVKAGDAPPSMVELLRHIAGRVDDEHEWIGDREARELRRRLASLPPDAPLEERWMLHARLGMCEAFLGNFEDAVREVSSAHALLPRIESRIPPELLYEFLLCGGVVWMRLGEVKNCCSRNTGDECIIPFREKGIHRDQEGSRRAIQYFTVLAERFPERHAPRWLLNVAHMTLGGYPSEVPPKLLIPPRAFESPESFPRFPNTAPRIGLDVFSLAGSVAVEDFDGDGFLDAMVSSWDPRVGLRLFRNSGHGTFVDRTAGSGLEGLLGGANLVLTDFDNDGRPDVLVLRGTWLGPAGRHPKSLLRNEGEGRFADVSFRAGLGAVHYPTEAAAWADYDRDGDLDLYVGNESGDGFEAPSQLFRNDGNGAFTDVAREAGVENFRFSKGVAWGDYDGDGFPDLYVSNLRDEENRLYRNNRDGTFTDVAPKLGVTRPLSSYSCWFWDYDNDGHLDLYVPSYQGGLEAVAAGYAGAPLPEGTELACLYRGDGRGGFAEVAAASGLRRPVMSMGANFGDLDNDGWLDFYLGTGYPEYEALMPNVMYRNREGRGFADVTFAGGFGHLQKGHGIAFADYDNDGTQDVFAQMGGAFRGDGAHFAMYDNPGFGNRWIQVRLVGVRSNRAAIGARIRVDVEDGVPRSLFRHVPSGGSFGANPFRQEIGLGKARVIDRLEVHWPAGGTTQTFLKVAVDQSIEVTEGHEGFRVIRPPPPGK